MPAPNASPFASVVRALLPERRLVGLRFTSPPSNDASLPPFEDRVMSVESDRREDWTALGAALASEKAAPGPPPYGIFIDALGLWARRRRGVGSPVSSRTAPEAVLREVLAQLSPGTPVVILAPSRIASADAAKSLRQSLLAEHTLEWLVHIGGAPMQSMRSLVLRCTTSTQPRKGAIVRLVNLTKVGPDMWREEICRASALERGESAHCIAMPLVRLGELPWIYERFTESHAQARRDAAALGPLAPLRDLVDASAVGLHPARDADLLHLALTDDDSASPVIPPGMIPVISGRCVRPGQLILQPSHMVEAERLPPRARLEPGDILVAEISRPQPGLVAAAVPEGLPCALGHHVICLRVRPGVAPATRELLLGWLLSQPAAAHQFSTIGSHVRVTRRDLLELEVPTPSSEVLQALSSLAELERWYDERAAAVRAARQDIFSATASNYRRAVGVLLDTQRHEGERVTAALDSQRFAYRVRNYFPHPLALRFEQLQVANPGRDQLQGLLGCAEYLVHFLALAGLVQLRSLHPDVKVASTSLRGSVKSRDLLLTWGLSRALLQESISASRRRKDPLTLPLPEFGSALGSLLRPEDALAQAEGLLRQQRNDEAHLRGAPAHELARRAGELNTALEQLLRAAEFLTETPLVHVRDYRLDGVSGVRWATLEWLRGASVVFERREHAVSRELPRGAVGLLDRSGAFHDLSPWLMLELCEECKRPEVFLFNRLEREAVTYVAMESGHLHRTATTLPAFAQLAAEE